MRLEADRSARPAALMRGSALCGALALLAAAAPARADVATMIPGSVQTSSGSATVSHPDANNIVVSTTAPRTLIDWNSFSVDAGQTATFNVNGARDAIVLNRVNGGSATISGTVRGCLDASCTVAGGNIWLYARDGVIINGSASIDAGGFLATVSPIMSEAGFLDPDNATFAFGAPTGSPTIAVGGTATFGIHGGTLALVAPRVTTASGVTVTGEAGNSDVLYGAADAYSITFAPDASSDLDLVSFLVPNAASGSSSTTPLTLAGSTSAGRVFAAAVSKPGVVSTLLSSGAITATQISGGGGEVTLAAGYGIGAGANAPVAGAGGGTVNIAGNITAPATITAKATGSVNQTDGIMSGGILTATAVYGLSFDRPNQMTGLGVITQIGGSARLDEQLITYRDVDDILLTDTISSGGTSYGARPILTLTSETGSIRQTGGILNVHGLDITAVTGIDLPNANMTGGGDGGSLPPSLGTLTNTASGGINYVAAGTWYEAAAMPAARISAPGQAVSLTALNGGLTVRRLHAGEATLLAQGDISLSEDIDVGAFGRVGGTKVSITNAGSIMLTDDVTATQLFLRSLAGSVSQSGGVIETSVRTEVVSLTGIHLGQANKIRNLERLRADTGDILVRNLHDLVLSGAGSIYAPNGTATLISNTGSVNSDHNFTGTLSIQAATGIDLHLISGANGAFGNLSTAAGGIRVVSSAPNASLVFADDIDAAGQEVRFTAAGAITQTGGVITAATLSSISRGGATYRLDNAVDALGTFTDSNGGALVFGASGALALTGDVSGWGSIKIQADGDLTVLSGSLQADGAGDAVILAANGDFINQAGANALQTPNGRWLIYSQLHDDPDAMPTGNVTGGLTAKAYYGNPYNFATGQFTTAPNAGNRFVYGYQPLLAVTPNATTVVYNGTVQAPSGYGVTGLLAGDDAGDAWSGAPGFTGVTSKNVGSYTVFATLGSLASDLNYGFSFGSATLKVDPKTLTGTATVDDKTYDGTTAGTGSVSLSGVISGDTVTAGGGSYSFADANAGIDKVVTVSGVVLGGADGGNYVISPLSGVGDILRRAITVTADNTGKIYGAADPELTYTLTTGSLVSDDHLAGALTRDSGEAVGFYDILLGTLAASSNYDLTYVAGEFEISASLGQSYTGSESQRCAADVEQCGPIVGPTEIAPNDPPPTIRWEDDSEDDG